MAEVNAQATTGDEVITILYQPSLTWQGQSSNRDVAVSLNTAVSAKNSYTFTGDLSVNGQLALVK